MYYKKFCNIFCDKNVHLFDVKKVPIKTSLTVTKPFNVYMPQISLKTAYDEFKNFVKLMELKYYMYFIW